MKYLLLLVLMVACCPKPPAQVEQQYVPEAIVVVPDPEPEKPTQLWYKGDCGIRQDDNRKFKIIAKDDEKYYVNVEVTYEIEGKMPETRVESELWSYGEFDDGSMKITCEF